MRHHAKCCADRSNRYRDIVIFKLLGFRLPPSCISLDVKFVTDQILLKLAEMWRFFKITAAAKLDFRNYKVLTVGSIISVELRHHAKFRGDWSNRCHNISILDFSRCWQPQAWIFKILHFNDLNGQEGRTASLCHIL